MSYWIFATLSLLIIPFAMIFFGFRFKKKPPKEINDIYGYRTTMSQKNKDTWEFAHHYYGKISGVLGIITLISSIIAMCFALNKSVNTIGYYVVIISFIQIVILFIPVIFTEIALKKNFDEYGRRKSKRF